MQDEKNVSPPNSGVPAADPLASLLSNPELIERIKTVLQSSAPTNSSAEGAILPSAPLPTDGSEQAPLAQETPLQDPLGALLGSASADGLSAVLSNPALMEKLPQVMAMLKPMLSASAPSAAPPAAPTQQVLAPLASPDRKMGGADDRDRLLLALKPFLSHERQEAVDAILRIAKLGLLLKKIT